MRRSAPNAAGGRGVRIEPQDRLQNRPDDETRAQDHESQQEREPSVVLDGQERGQELQGAKPARAVATCPVATQAPSRQIRRVSVRPQDAAARLDHGANDITGVGWAIVATCTEAR